MICRKIQTNVVRPFNGPTKVPSRRWIRARHSRPAPGVLYPATNPGHACAWMMPTLSDGFAFPARVPSAVSRHSLRSGFTTCATAPRRSFWHRRELRYITELLGHSQVSFTMQTYTHVPPEVQRSAATKMDEISCADPSCNQGC